MGWLVGGSGEQQIDLISECDGFAGPVAIALLNFDTVTRPDLC